jgi:hypothetical protein
MPFPQNQFKRLIPAKRAEWPIAPWIPNNPNLTDKQLHTRANMLWKNSKKT